MKIDPEGPGPVAIRTKLGWSVHGPEHHLFHIEVQQPKFLICECQSIEQSNIDQMMENYFSMEEYGINI